MENLWFILITMVSTSISEVEGIPVLPGDVISSSLVAATETLEDCKIVAEGLAQTLDDVSQGSTVSVASCILMNADVVKFQRFEDVPKEEDLAI